MAAVPQSPATPTAADDIARGLTPEEVETRVAAGAVNRAARKPSRTVGEIVRANVFTPFNAILGALLVAAIIVGPPSSATFGIVLVLNTVVGVGQELRSKRTLDKLAVVAAARVRVVRAGQVQEIAVDEVVADDVIDIGTGDQAVVDGDVLQSHGLEIDESLLTGEAEPQEKPAGSTVFSGSFVVAGSGRFRATHVGKAAYAEQLAQQASRFSQAPSELRSGINRLLIIITWAMIPTGVVLVLGQLHTHEPYVEVIRAAIAGLVAMVPSGLVLLTNVTFAVSVQRLARRKTVVQELQSVETLARVDVPGQDRHAHRRNVRRRSRRRPWFRDAVRCGARCPGGC